MDASCPRGSQLGTQTILVRRKTVYPVSENAKTTAAYGRSTNALLPRIMLDNKEFNEALGEVTTAWGRQDLIGALEQLDELILRVTSEMQAQCLLFKGRIMKDQGLDLDARKEWLQAIPRSRSGSFVRACLEYETGMSFEKENLVEDARKYYQSAIETCAIGDEFSGNKQLGAYLALNDGKIMPGDESIIEAALVKSWRVLELPGEPSSANLPDSITRLCEGFSEMIRRIREP